MLVHHFLHFFQRDVGIVCDQRRNARRHRPEGNKGKNQAVEKGETVHAAEVFADGASFFFCHDDPSSFRDVSSFSCSKHSTKIRGTWQSVARCRPTGAKCHTGR